MRSWTAPESLKDKMLVLLYELTEADTGQLVNKETLAMEAWRRHPADFGMSLYPTYPNTSTAYSVLSKLTFEAFATLGGTSQYGITTKGVHRACRMVEVPVVRRKKVEETAPAPEAPPEKKRRNVPEDVAKHPDFLAILNKYKAPR
jgi:hypothetical protein